LYCTAHVNCCNCDQWSSILRVLQVIQSSSSSSKYPTDSPSRDIIQSKTYEIQLPGNHLHLDMSRNWSSFPERQFCNQVTLGNIFAFMQYMEEYVADCCWCRKEKSTGRWAKFWGEGTLRYLNLHHLQLSKIRVTRVMIGYEGYRPFSHYWLLSKIRVTRVTDLVTIRKPDFEKQSVVREL
jgi:hypothetical protein